jgi:hypothetical protein
MPLRPARCPLAAGLAVLLAASAAHGQQPLAALPDPDHPPQQPRPPAVLTVDDYLNCVRGCNEIFGAVAGSEAPLECIRGCRWTSSRETLAPEAEQP